MGKSKSLFILSIFKYLFLFYISFILEKNLQNSSPNLIIYYLKENEIITNIFIEHFNKLIILFSFGIILNLLIIFFLMENRSRFLSFSLGIIKITTLAPISGLTLFFNTFTMKNIKQKSYLDNKNESNFNKENKPIKMQKEMSNNDKSVWLNFKTRNKTSPISFISVILFILILIGSMMAFSFHALFGIVALVVGIAWVVWFNARKVYKNKLNKIIYGMPIEEVKFIMGKTKINKEGYTKTGYFVLIYEIKSFFNHGDYEKEIFYFEDGILVDRDYAYKRTKTKNW